MDIYTRPTRVHPAQLGYTNVKDSLNSLKPPSALVRMFWLVVIVFLNCLRPNLASTSNFIYIWGYFHFEIAIVGVHNIMEAKPEFYGRFWGRK